jgi:type I restriction enzyme R subunit
VNEAQTRLEFIDPALKRSGWNVVTDSYMRVEYTIAPGRIEVGRQQQRTSADYVLEYRNTKLAVVEAKALHEEYTLGVAQAKEYAGKLGVRFAYATNGQQIYEMDLEEGRECEVSHYPSPEELWERTFQVPNEWRDRFAKVPYENRGGSHGGRYYQELAVHRALEAVAHNKPRILLTLATGTGKTFIAFQIAWKLFHSRWNLSREPTRRPRVLFLADRNILADQAYNEFSAFEEDARARVSPDEIRKRGRVPKNASIFFTIFQTFMSGTDADGNPAPYFGDYPPDFFDFIIIDECHRGGAQDESNWRGILEYFSPAVQLGLTATPKRKDNVDTYAYFGDPVYVYSLKDGINDGFLTPFKVKNFSTTIDQYQYTKDDHVISGDPEPGRIYGDPDMHRVIIIEEREEYKVKLLLADMNQNEKTIIFCATQNHALMIRDLINQISDSKDPNYCHRVTADDGARGEQHLRNFQDNERTIPTILTTSEKLATGVDARNIRNIVLMRPINSMIEFKQIIGRGTRLYDGKFYFTIYDFVRAHENFNDPDWDGEPVEPEPGETKKRPPAPDKPKVEEEPEEWEANEKIVIKLADGKVREFQHMVKTSFWDPSGVPITATQFIERLFGKVPEFFKDEAELRKLWSQPETRRALLDRLAEAGFPEAQLEEMQRAIDAEDSDIFDVLAYIAYGLPKRTRLERAEQARSNLDGYNPKLRAFLEFVLSHYVAGGVDELDVKKLAPLLRLKYHNSIGDALKDLGSDAAVRQAFVGFQQYLYRTDP